MRGVIKKAAVGSRPQSMLQLSKISPKAENYEFICIDCGWLRRLFDCADF
jgi:hypothetical protein